jgi:protein involved in polysaccharide export with SLBB domain
MKTGERWSSWKLSAGWLIALPMLVCAPGCAKDRTLVDQNLQSSQGDDGAVVRTYRVACPDVIELQILQRPEFDGLYEIGADGRINLGDYGNLRIEGRTLPEVAKVISEETGSIPISVRVKMREYRSQHVVLIGEVNGAQRSIAYRGPETVLELLQRIGGITHDGAQDDVYVVRPHVGDNQRPEVFHVDLHAIIVNGDNKTNLRMQPFDQVFVGESRRAKIEKAIPLWVRWLYQTPEISRQQLAVSRQNTAVSSQQNTAVSSQQNTAVSGQQPAASQ